MPRIAHTDMRFNNPKYLDSGGNELELLPNGEGRIIDWQRWRRVGIARLEVVERARQAKTRKAMLEILAECPRRQEWEALPDGTPMGSDGKYATKEEA